MLDCLLIKLTSVKSTEKGNDQPGTTPQVEHGPGEMSPARCVTQITRPLCHAVVGCELRPSLSSAVYTVQRLQMCGIMNRQDQKKFPQVCELFPERS